jgi:2-polyprenyl-3-methyl-5-hydroxy-6-metoxy-1,4-benzoquinol methylase
MEMLEHARSASVVKACADLAKPGGWVFSRPSTET